MAGGLLGHKCWNKVGHQYHSTGSAFASDAMLPLRMPSNRFTLAKSLLRLWNSSEPRGGTDPEGQALWFGELRGLRTLVTNPFL